jgi:NAD(P)-dependent dehydrogenase (short-subunit alcohol dehydrogenase family)
LLLKDKIALVSGAGAGTGRAIAMAFAREGADLVLAARHASSWEPIAEEVRGLGRRALGVEADITSAADREALLAASLAEYGRIDILANNAFAMGRMENMVGGNIEATWKVPFKVNLFGTLALSELVGRSMCETGGGAIVMLASMAGRKAQAGMVAYGASKAALMFAARGLATELGPHGVRVNCVVPSHIDGPNLRVYFKMEAEARGISEEDVYRETAAEGVLTHVCTAAEVAECVLFLASPMASAVTGQSLDVNCGQWFD